MSDNQAEKDALTEDELGAIDDALIDTGCHGFRGDHPELYAAAAKVARERVTAALAETVARIEAVTPREAMRPNERRTYWQGVRDALAVVSGHHDQIKEGR